MKHPLIILAGIGCTLVFGHHFSEDYYPGKDRDDAARELRQVSIDRSADADYIARHIDPVPVRSRSIVQTQIDDLDDEADEATTVAARIDDDSDFDPDDYDVD